MLVLAIIWQAVLRAAFIVLGFVVGYVWGLIAIAIVLAFEIKGLFVIKERKNTLEQFEQADFNREIELSNAKAEIDILKENINELLAEKYKDKLTPRMQEFFAWLNGQLPGRRFDTSSFRHTGKCIISVWWWERLGSDNHLMVETFQPPSGISIVQWAFLRPDEKRDLRDVANAVECYQTPLTDLESRVINDVEALLPEKHYYTVKQVIDALNKLGYDVEGETWQVYS